ncbi:putative cytochrome p450 protein [Neofusicoccum parvum UCRNP2]|uniref:Putative cytochrome p450 protein n=1 Tax=Botryosphaeria parva (strain UCR-NP2) TaxID=1287680 RepID=R1EIN0_BOTPV|nr:putative cytochrome p450 protein [Neofusicoccum parvum UCRNP2]
MHPGSIEPNAKSRLPLFAVALVVALLVLQRFLAQRARRDEPPEAGAAIPIPYIGHMIGLMRHKMGYYVRLSKNNPLPVYSITTFGGKVYVVNAPDVASAVFRNTKDLSFARMAAEVVSRVSLSSTEGTQTMLKNANGYQGDKGYTPEGFKLLHAALAPGPGLQDMISTATARVSATLGQLEPEPGKPSTPVMLYASLQHLIGQATSDAVYGPMNPFRDPDVEQAFWDFEQNFTLLLVNVAPSFTARRGHRGRQRLHQAFEHYFREKGHLEGSSVVKARYDVADRHALSIEDMARFEATMAIGILGTTSPATFWMVFYLFSQPALLEQLRAATAPFVTTTAGADGQPHRTADVGRIRALPLVTSVWHEVLRRSACGTSARLVERDCTLPLSPPVLLRRGGVVQMPSRVPHTDRRLWGAAVGDFDPARFADRKPAQPGAFRPFGGGNTLCPGRHLAAAEITGVAVMMALRFDLEPAGAAGMAWVEPAMYATSVAAAIYSPEADIPVLIRKRRGYETGTWEFH